MKKLFVALLCGFAVACSDDDNNNDDINSGTTNEPQNTESWDSAFYNWTAMGPEECTNNRVTIKPDKVIAENSCGEVDTATVSDDDFAVFESALQLVLPEFDGALQCTNEAVMDYSVNLRVKVDGKVRRVYSFDETELCYRGSNRAAVENLQNNLENLRSKYLAED
jgi:hypothetical protein